MVAYSFQELTAIPKTILQQTNIERLDLRHNKLTYIPREIVKLKNLKSLNISYNNLEILPNI
nr:leucine-rich repeat domain-containing protein [Xenococcaceae cyanobacterium MO_188.B19]